MVCGVGVEAMRLKWFLNTNDDVVLVECLEFEVNEEKVANQTLLKIGLDGVELEEDALKWRMLCSKDDRTREERTRRQYGQSLNEKREVRSRSRWLPRVPSPTKSDATKVSKVFPDVLGPKFSLFESNQTRSPAVDSSPRSISKSRSEKLAPLTKRLCSLPSKEEKSNGVLEQGSDKKIMSNEK
jgi:hypothetical protein